jgi:hypothetical protein
MRPSLLLDRNARRNRLTRERSMKLIALAAVVLLAVPSLAQAASECSTIRSAKARLACFDQANPAQSPETKADKTTFSDKNNPYAREDAATAAKLKGICRGC